MKSWNLSECCWPTWPSTNILGPIVQSNIIAIVDGMEKVRIVQNSLNSRHPFLNECFQ